MSRIPSSMIQQYAKWFATAMIFASAAFAQNPSTHGNIVSGAATCQSSNCVYYQLPPNTPYVVVTISGTWSGTIAFQSISAPNANYSNLNSVPWTNVATEIANGNWSVSTGGATFLLIQAPTWSSGSAQVSMFASQTGSPMNNPVFPGTITATGLQAPDAGSPTEFWQTNGGHAPSTGCGISGTCPISAGGTGATTAAGAFNNIAAGIKIASAYCGISTDAGVCIQNAINSLGSNPGAVWVTPDMASLTFGTGVTVSHNGQYIVCVGDKRSTPIGVTSGFSGTAFTFSAGAQVLVDNGLSGCYFVGAGNTNQKTFLVAKDVSNFKVHDNELLLWHSAAYDSIGFALYGRQFIYDDRNQWGSDTPIQINPNPNSSITLDVSHFYDDGLVDVGNPNGICIQIIGDGTGRLFQHNDFAKTSCNGGKYMVYWNDLSNPYSNKSNTFKSMEWEQADDATGAGIYMAANTIDTLVQNVEIGLSATGLYLRGARQFIAENVLYGNSAGACFDFDTSSQTIILIDNYCQGGSTINHGTMVEILGAPTYGGVTAMQMWSNPVGGIALSPTAFMPASITVTGTTGTPVQSTVTTGNALTGVSTGGFAIHGYDSGGGVGVYGSSTSGRGVEGTSDGTGVGGYFLGQSSGADAIYAEGIGPNVVHAVAATPSTIAVTGVNGLGGIAVSAFSQDGIAGFFTDNAGGDGVEASSQTGVGANISTSSGTTITTFRSGGLAGPIVASISNTGAVNATSFINPNGTLLPSTLTGTNGNSSGVKIPLAIAWTGSSVGLPVCPDANGNLTVVGCTLTNAFSGGLGASYQDVTEIAAPSDPASGNDRLYTNSSTHLLACLTAGGLDCMPYGSGTFVTLSGDATSTATGGATTVQGLKGVPFCTGFTPTNGQAVEYTTGGTPNPCYSAAIPSGSGTVTDGSGTTTTPEFAESTGTAHVQQYRSASQALGDMGAQASLSLLAGTYTNGDWCSYTSSGTLLNCNNAVPQPALSLLKGTYVDGDMCTYTTSGTLLNCNLATSTFDASGAAAARAAVGSCSAGQYVTATTTSGVTCAGIATVQLTMPTSTITANTCTTPATVTMTGLVAPSGATPGSTFTVAYEGNPNAITGWGSSGGLSLKVWVSATSTASWSVCNVTGSDITPDALKVDVGAK